MAAIIIYEHTDITAAEVRRAVLQLNSWYGPSSPLWKDNIIHGEQFLTHGRNVSMADISTSLLKLYRANLIEPMKFRPGLSGAAFLGLDVSHRSPHLKPHAGDAAHWDWKILYNLDQIGKGK